MTVPEIPGTFPEREHESVPPVPDIGVRNEVRPIFLDVAAFLAGGLPEGPRPTIGRRTDRCGLFYRGHVNLAFGDPESGKTLLAQSAGVEVLQDGERLAVLDLDHNGPGATLDRLIRMGAASGALADPDRFRYVEPEDQWHLAQVVKALRSWQATLIVVDSIGELLPLMGLSSNSPDDFTVAHTRVLKPLAMSGAGVIAIDHVAKNVDSKNMGPTGTNAKRRAVSGTSIRVSVTRTFTPGQGGAAALTINKDRHGGLRRHSPAPDGKGEVFAGTFVIEEDGTTMRCRVTAPAADESFPIHGSDVDTLAKLDPPPKSVADVKARLKWGTTRAADALKTFREDPYLVPHPYVRNEEHARKCTVCGFPMVEVGDGATTHPGCEVAS